MQLRAMHTTNKCRSSMKNVCMYVNICMIHMYDGSNAQWSMQQQTDKYQINMCVHSISKFSSKHLLGVFEWTSNVPPQTAMCPYPWMPWVSLYTTVHPPTRFYIWNIFQKEILIFAEPTNPPTKWNNFLSNLFKFFVHFPLGGTPPYRWIPQQLFRSARTSWITFVCSFILPSARKIWIICITL